MKSTPKPPPRRMTPEVRRRVMSSIHKKDTAPELTLRRALWRAGLRGWRCHVKLPGSPDVAFARWHVAVFVDGVWWHGHPDYLPRGRRGPYWDAKIAGNRARDARVDAALSSSGWLVLRIWDVDVMQDPDAAAARVVEALVARGWGGRRLR